MQPTIPLVSKKPSWQQKVIGACCITIGLCIIAITIKLYTVNKTTPRTIEEEMVDNAYKESQRIIARAEAQEKVRKETYSVQDWIDHNAEAAKFQPVPYKSYEEYVAHLKGMNFPDSLIDTREEYIDKYPEQMTYEEYVAGMMKFNLRVRSREEFEVMFNKKSEVKAEEDWHMSYEEYVALMFAHNQRVGTREEFEKLFSLEEKESETE